MSKNIAIRSIYEQNKDIQLPRIEALIDDCVVPCSINLHFCLARQLAQSQAIGNNGTYRHDDKSTNDVQRKRHNETGQYVAVVTIRANSEQRFEINDEARGVRIGNKPGNSPRITSISVILPHRA